MKLTALYLYILISCSKIFCVTISIKLQNTAEYKLLKNIKANGY